MVLVGGRDRNWHRRMGVGRRFRVVPGCGPSPLVDGSDIRLAGPFLGKHLLLKPRRRSPSGAIRDKDDPPPKPISRTWCWGFSSSSAMVDSMIFRLIRFLKRPNTNEPNHRFGLRNCDAMNCCMRMMSLG